MSNIPYTTAASDFLKLVEFKEDSKPNTINYAATDFLSLRDNLISYIKAVYPLDYNLFVESDLGMMMVELVSYMGAVMSMKADMLAHENFLKTARNPVNVRKLLQLIGVKFRGPSSAAAQCTITAATTTPALTSGQYHTIAAADRVFNTTSPVDGKSITYTLYQIKNGKIVDIEASNEIKLTYEDSDSTNGRTWSNLALIEGVLAVDSGTFSDVDVIKSVSLANSPVVDGSIQVYIDTGDAATSKPFREVESLLSTSSSDDAAFEVVYAPDYSAKVVFGDGVTGELPPIGSTYTIAYRVGGGERGNARTGLINQSVTAQTTSYSLQVENEYPFTGGANAETIDHAKKYAQLSFKQQDRLVSLDDYVSFANRFRSSTGGSGKAIAATRRAFSSGNVVDVYLVEKASSTQVQKASIAFKTDLLSAMEQKKMITDEIVLVDGLIRTLDLNVEVTLDSRFQNKEGVIKGKLSRVILDQFNVDNREFGQDFFPEEISRELFTEVPEVRLAKVTNYDKPVALEFNEILQINNFEISFNYV